jgi:hypothetical protein
MEATLGISLYSYLYLKLAKNNRSFLLSLFFFSSTKLEKREKEILPGSGRWEGEKGGERWYKQCIHM